MTTLPECIGQLSQLTWLNLSDNQLTTLPKSVEQLPQLQILYLDKNKLTKLRKSLKDRFELSLQKSKKYWEKINE